MSKKDETMAMPLTVHADAPLAKAPEPSVGALMQAVIERGITPDAVGVMERLIEMRRQIKADDARAAFATYRADKAAHPLFIDRVRATY